jgi:hypothetical protein
MLIVIDDGIYYSSGLINRIHRIGDAKASTMLLLLTILQIHLFVLSNYTTENLDAM